jgi:signal transduction histidine kinase
LALWYTLVTLGSLLLAAAAFTLRAETSIHEQGERSAQGTLEQFRRAFERGGALAMQSQFECTPVSKLALRLSDERDTELFSMSSDPDSREAAKDTENHSRRVSGWHFARTQVSRQRTLSIAFQDERAEGLWHELRQTFVLVFCIGLGVALLGAALLTRRALRPVSNLAQATQEIIESGNLALRVDTPARADELARLTQLFNQMLAKNEQLVKAMRESLEDVAHDLRTPLARLRAGAELALQPPPDSEKQQNALADIVEETDGVLAMLTTLTDVVEAEAGAMRLDRHPEELGAIARQSVELYEFVSKDVGVSLVTHIAADVLVSVDRRRILQVCSNLIDNAIKYTQAGGHVDVTVFREQRWGVFQVKDSGIGIAPEHLDRVWERLYRADPSRGAHGLGLGLSLVKAVVEAHGGQVRVESRVGQGSCFEVRLPLASSNG